jgi:murein DD-endopeptidase MepM/ murein hydrolase activator NlpD
LVNYPLIDQSREANPQTRHPGGVDATFTGSVWYRPIRRNAIVTETHFKAQPASRSARRQAIRRRAQRRHFHFYSRCPTWTFAQNVAAAPISWRREHWALGGAALVLTLLIGFVLPGWANAMRRDAVATPYTTLDLRLPALPPGAEDGGGAADGNRELDWKTVRIHAGETMADVFSRQGLSPAVLQRTLDALADRSALRTIHPGDEFGFAFTGDGNLAAMRFDRGDAERVMLTYDAAGVHASEESRALMQQVRYAHGVVDGSLFDAANRGGMSDAMVLKLADVFKYDIDFARELRPGDSFTVIYDKIYRDGAFQRDGDIIAAEFVNRGKRYTAYRFQLPDGSIGYYSEDGRPLRKSLMRTPVAFTRISSRFTSSRRHPILGYTRAHKGVDYAAPKGTPIHAAGDGVITFRGRARGYGNFVTIRHNKTYTTAYGHMSRFAKIHVGEHVHQGEVIGYVGMTGLATGPHLHYEVRVHGVQENPLTVTMPKPEPLPSARIAEFHRVTAPYVARIQTIDARRALARNAGSSGRSRG